MIVEEGMDYLRKACKIASETREYAKGLIKPDGSLLEATEKIEAKITELGAQMAFPPQISRNAIAAHYCSAPDDETVFLKGDMVKIDIGTHINGYIGDTALTVDLGDDIELVRASREALNNAIKMIHPGVKIRDIGKTIGETIESAGFNPVKNLSGHGLGSYSIHEAPSIPNFDNKDESVLQEDQLIAIEPFATRGIGLVQEQGNPEIFSLAKKKPVRNIIVRNALKDIQKFKGLPFTTRWIKLPLFKTHFALRELGEIGSLNSYPPLVEKTKENVSQAEHTILVRDKPEILTK